MSFWRNKSLNSDEYEKLQKKIIDLDAKIEKANVDLRILQTDYNNLRGNFNRKLSGLKKEEADQEQKEETKDINNPVILPMHGYPFQFK